MAEHLKDFWRRLQTGVEVAVAGSSPELLLGVRDAFVRYFHAGLQRPISVAVVPQPRPAEPVGLVVGDEEVMRRARQGAQGLQARLGETYHFYVATEGGISALELAGRSRYFVRNWTIVLGSLGEAWGSSGSVELPERVIGPLREALPASIPGTRRRGGIISSLTGGLETRRSAVALSTLHALSSLCYGILQSRPVPLG